MSTAFPGYTSQNINKSTHSKVRAHMQHMLEHFVIKATSVLSRVPAGQPPYVETASTSNSVPLHSNHGGNFRLHSASAITLSHH